MAMISLVDRDRQWFKARVGLESPRRRERSPSALMPSWGRRSWSSRTPTADARFAGNPLVTGDPGIRFYAGAPLRSRTAATRSARSACSTASRAPSHGRQTAALETLAREVVARLDLARATPSSTGRRRPPRSRPRRCARAKSSRRG